jgi:predicted HD phosphohydrolase
MNQIDQIFVWFDRHGALQTGAFAESEAAEPALITAALLHDTGHLIHDLGNAPPARGIDDRNEMSGDQFLAG